MSYIGKLTTKNYSGYPIGLSNESSNVIGNIVEVYNDKQLAVDNYVSLCSEKCDDCNCEQKTMVNNKKTTHFIIGEKEKQGFLALDVFEMNKLTHDCGNSAFLLSNKSCFPQNIIFFTSSNKLARFNNILFNNEGEHVIFSLISGRGLFIGKDYVLYA